MSWLSTSAFYVKSLFQRRKLDAQLTEEIQSHVDMATEANVAAGMSPEEARYAALREFGNVASVQERTRAEHGWMWLEQWIRDLRFSVRSLWRAKGFSLTVLATLALCLGPNTAILSVLYALVYKPLPFHEPERLVSITNVADKNGGAKRPSSVAQYLDFKAHADRFEGFGYYTATNVTIGEEDTPVRGPCLQMGGELISTLGVQPLLGRGFLPDEQVPGQDHVVLLSHGAWVKRYHADETVIGRKIRVDSELYTVVGVAPEVFEQLFVDVELFKPYMVGPNEGDPLARYAGSVRLVGRLKPGMSIDAGRAQLAVLEKAFYDSGATLQARTFLDAGGYRIGISDAREELSEPIKAPLLLLQGGAVLVLLIGCVNVASLLLARTNAKRPELAIRQALGAGRTVLLRQMLAESFWLVSLAGVIGICLALGMLRFMNRYESMVVRHVPPVEMNWHVLAMVGAIVGVIVLTMAVVPFVLLWRSELKIGETPRASTGQRGRRALNALVVGQVALALVLLISAGLLIHSFARVMAVKPGFDAERIVQGRVNLPYSKYKDPKDNVGLQQRLLAAMKEIPGVEAASLTTEFGVAEKYRTAPFLLHGNNAVAGDAQALVNINSVSPDYFATMGIRLRDGRVFRDDDEFRKSPVAIVDQAFAERYFPGRDVVGQELVLGTNPPKDGQPWIRIIGVVARANLAGLEGRDGWPFLYIPFNQQPSLGFSFLVRSSRSETDVVNEMRARVRAVDPALPVYATGTLAAGLDGMLGNRRAIMFLLGLFAVLALLLATVGLYGVLNYDVSQRTREIGIRGAIGATRAQIVQMILRQGLTKAGLGLAVGLTGAFFFTRLLRKMLFEISPTDPLAYAAVTALLLFVALAASWLPARRAAKVDPVIALRAE